MLSSLVNSIALVRNRGLDKMPTEFIFNCMNWYVCGVLYDINFALNNNKSLAMMMYFVQNHFKSEVVMRHALKETF